MRIEQFQGLIVSYTYLKFVKRLIMKNTKKKLRNSILPLIIISKICGFLPVSIKITEAKSSEISIISVIHGLINLSLVFYRAVELYSGLNFGKNYIQDLTLMVFPIINIIACSSILINAKTFSKVLNNLFSYSIFIKSNRLYKIIFFIVLLEIFIYQILLNYYVLKNAIRFIDFTDWKYLLQILSDLIVANFLALGNIWFGNILLFLCIVLKKIHGDLDKLEPVKYLKDNRIKQLDLSSLILLRKDVFDTCEDVNDCFGMFSAAYAVYVMIHLALASMYFLFFRFEIDVTLAWMTNLFLQMYLVLFAIEKLIREVRLVTFKIYS